MFVRTILLKYGERKLEPYDDCRPGVGWLVGSPQEMESANDDDYGVLHISSQGRWFSVVLGWC